MNQTADVLALTLPDEVRVELGKMAQERQTTEVELATRAIRQLVRPRPVGIPRFARRLGPISED